VAKQYIRVGVGASLAIPATFMVSGVLLFSMEEAPTFDEYRTAYIAARWEVSDNCAKALQLFEIGFTISGASKHLPVTEGTVSKYHSELMEKIHPNIVFSLGGKGRDGNYDVWGKRSEARHFKEWGKGEGHAHGTEMRHRAENAQATDRKEQIDPEFRERELPLNKGCSLKDIPKDLITIRTEVEA